jgi:hypothetical protein
VAKAQERLEKDSVRQAPDHLTPKTEPPVGTVRAKPETEERE